MSVPTWMTQPRARRRQQRSDLPCHHDFADQGRGRQPRHVQRQGVVILHAERRGVDDDIEPGRIFDPTATASAG